jgi:hypothetical protein
VELSFCVVVSGSFLQRVLTEEVRPEPVWEGEMTARHANSNQQHVTPAHEQVIVGLGRRTSDVELQESSHGNAGGEHEAPAGSSTTGLGNLNMDMSNAYVSTPHNFVHARVVWEAAART